MKRLLPALVLLLVGPAGAQEGGWHYAPFPGEGDRAALGCSAGSSPDSHTCIAVRCEDDYSIGIYLKTTREGGDTGRWSLVVDKDVLPFTAVATEAPYGAKVEADPAIVLDWIKQGGEAYVDPLDGAGPSSRSIPLGGSMLAINQALFFCAPTRQEPEATEPVINLNLIAPVPETQLMR